MHKVSKLFATFFLTTIPLVALANPFAADAKNQHKVLNSSKVRNQLKLKFYNKMVSLSHEAFLDARRAGVEMESPANGIRKYNSTFMGQVGPLVVLSHSDNGEFVTFANDNGNVAGFGVKGYGLELITGWLKPGFFNNKKNKLTKNCKYVMPSGSEYPTYSCSYFLNPKNNMALLHILEASIAADLKSGG